MLFDNYQVFCEMHCNWLEKLNANLAMDAIQGVNCPHNTHDVPCCALEIFTFNETIPSILGGGRP